MPKFIMNIWNVLPGVIGVVQQSLPLVKDLMVLTVRIIAILPFLWSADQPIIVKIDKYYKVVYNAIEKAKNAMLLIK